MVVTMVLCYFAFPPQRHEESSRQIRLKKWFLLLLFFSATAHERKKSGKISGEKQRNGKKEIRADRYPSRTSGDETKGECYGLISPVVTNLPSE